MDSQIARVGSSWTGHDCTDGQIHDDGARSPGPVGVASREIIDVIINMVQGEDYRLLRMRLGS